MDGMLDYETAKEQWEGLQAAIAKAEDEVEALSLLISEKAVAFPREMATLYLAGDDKAARKLVDANSEISERRHRVMAALDGLRQAEAEVSQIVGAHELHERRIQEFEDAKTALVALAARKAEFDTRMELAASNTERRHLIEEFRDVRLIPKRTFLTRRLATGLGCTEDFDLWLAQLGLEVVARNPVSGVRVGYLH
jgi:hypothetical protein